MGLFQLQNTISGLNFSVLLPYGVPSIVLKIYSESAANLPANLAFLPNPSHTVRSLAIVFITFLTAVSF